MPSRQIKILYNILRGAFIANQKFSKVCYVMIIHSKFGSNLTFEKFWQARGIFLFVIAARLRVCLLLLG